MKKSTDKAPTIQVRARCKCEPFNFVLLYRANRLADLTCPECREVAAHLDIEWPARLL